MDARPHPDDVPPRWAEDGSGERYATTRWANPRARERDVRRLSRILRNLPLPPTARLLDVPCGAGRLHDALAARGTWTGVDASAAMLAAAPGARVHGDAFALPFDDDVFDLVVCCRLFHHMTDDGARGELLAELARVSRGPVALTFWDAGSWHAWRRRRGWRRATDTRVPIARAHLHRLLAEAGLEPVRTAASLRFVSPQTWLLARKVDA